MGEGESGGKDNNLDSHQSGSFGRKITEEEGDPRPTEGGEVGNTSQPDGACGAEKNPQTNAVEDGKGSGSTQQLSRLTVIDGPMANGGGGGPAEDGGAKDLQKTEDKEAKEAERWWKIRNSAS